VLDMPVILSNAVVAKAVGSQLLDGTYQPHALRLYELGLIKSNSKKIIAEKTDWRFFKPQTRAEGANETKGGYQCRRCKRGAGF
jgi:hypothetical protein